MISSILQSFLDSQALLKILKTKKFELIFKVTCLTWRTCTLLWEAFVELESLFKFYKVGKKADFAKVPKLCFLIGNHDLPCGNRRSILLERCITTLLSLTLIMMWTRAVIDFYKRRQDTGAMVRVWNINSALTGPEHRRQTLCRSPHAVEQS